MQIASLLFILSRIQSLIFLLDGETVCGLKMISSRLGQKRSLVLELLGGSSSSSPVACDEFIVKLLWIPVFSPIISHPISLTHEGEKHVRQQKPSTSSLTRRLNQLIYYFKENYYGLFGGSDDACQ